jgi:hypothetical protein
MCDLTSHSRHRKGDYFFFVFRLEGGCNYDYILVYDGPQYNSSLIARVCDGSNGSFTSTGNFMSVVFITDGSVTRRGFQAHYYSTVSTSKFPCGNECPCGIGDVKRDYLSLNFSDNGNRVLLWVPCLLRKIVAHSLGSDLGKGWPVLTDGMYNGFPVIIRHYMSKVIFHR